MNQELEFHQKVRLGEKMSLANAIEEARFKGDGVFHAKAFGVEFDISFSNDDTDYILNGLKLTREEA